ncbi:hypothetical protein MCAG_05512 [Micromonospora sp. ATCC 39149]|uniref:Serine/threonine protein kinase n=1 Tax=Micromonospora carbonacea TaxID=47853 RepID=A0A7D6GH44_9ACTN|nr:hypothetical protein [Micromonospora sp. ATCC 39149]EEP75185.1 hypothetical protein MCAG_05512 [Micromonospora sp. ATCC 39149]QLK00907.1 hypothetical protein HZU44_13505 [Micromonospora carbonacea]
MKRLTPLLTLVTGAGMAAVLFAMSAQAAPAAAPPKVEAAPPASTAAPADAPPEQATPRPPELSPGASAPPAAPGATDVPAAGTPEQKVDASWTGRLDNGATIAITSRDGAAEAYVCDGKELELWLRGTATDGKLKLDGKDATLTGTFDDSGATGKLAVGGGESTFTAKATAGTAPVVYRATPSLRDAGVDGGWILRPDGTQIGVLTWNGRPMPAPPLDPAFGTTIVEGLTLTAQPVIPGPGPRR